METDISYWGSDILSKGSIENRDKCAELCASTDGGFFWTYIAGDKQCYVKGSAERRTSLDGRISGNVACGVTEPPGARTKTNKKKVKKCCHI